MEIEIIREWLLPRDPAKPLTYSLFQPAVRLVPFRQERIRVRKPAFLPPEEFENLTPE